MYIAVLSEDNLIAIKITAEPLLQYFPCSLDFKPLAAAYGAST